MAVETTGGVIAPDQEMTAESHEWKVKKKYLFKIMGHARNDKLSILS